MLADAATGQLVDDTPRVFGKTQWTHYRIKLTTPGGTYYSTPMHCWGSLDFRFWRLIANRERIYTLQFSPTTLSQFEQASNGFKKPLGFM